MIHEWKNIYDELKHIQKIYKMGLSLLRLFIADEFKMDGGSNAWMFVHTGVLHLVR